MYEKGNVSIREEKKYRECSIRQVTSKVKLRVLKGRGLGEVGGNPPLLLTPKPSTLPENSLAKKQIFTIIVVDSLVHRYVFLDIGPSL